MGGWSVFMVCCKLSRNVVMLVMKISIIVIVLNRMVLIVCF